MIHVDKVSTVKKAGTGTGTISGMHRTTSKSGINQLTHSTDSVKGMGIPFSPPRSGPRGFLPLSPLLGQSYPLTRTPLRDATLMEQITSNTFIQLTIFFVISSFWANFIIGEPHTLYPLYPASCHLFANDILPSFLAILLNHLDLGRASQSS